jgi:cytochrome P450
MSIVPKSTPKYDLLSSEFFASPEPTLQAMRENDPVYWHEDVKCWIVTRYDDVQYVLRDKRFSVDRSGLIGTGSSAQVSEKVKWCNEFLRNWLVFSDPPRHTRLRALVSRAFIPQRIAGLREPIERLAEELLSRVAEQGTMEVVSDLALPLPSLLTGEMLGLPRKRSDDLKRWSDDLFRLVGAGVASDDLVTASHQGLRECREYFAEVVEERRRSRGDDLISQLVVAADQDPEITKDELIAVCATLMAGSYETTTHLIANGLFALLTHPDQMKLLKDQPSLIESAVEELIRYNGPALSLVRRPLVDIELHGHAISAGENVCCMLHAANHDPAHFREPGRLDITRAENRHVGLGVGIHFCLGAALTRLETRIALSSLIRLPNLELDDDHVVFRPNLVMRGLQSLRVRFSPRRAKWGHSSSAATSDSAAV